jgi:thioredoxin-related protein
MQMRGHMALAAIALTLLAIGIPARADDPPLLAPGQGPPPSGISEPKVTPIKGDDGIYHQSWFAMSFLDLKDEYAEAQKSGQRLAVIFEQRGCIYCTKMHTEVLAERYINDYVRENFRIVQLDLWGSRETTDFDGTKLPEKKLAERWGVMFTPTIVFFKDDLTPGDGKWGPSVEVVRMNLGMGAGTFYDMFVWVREKVYAKDRNFQRFHGERAHQRIAVGKGAE